jgi:hypothetical protein
MKLSENLHAGDLRDLVKKVFEIDGFKSKIGDDEDICVLSFTVDDKDAAEDLENFIEMGYNFVLDSDVTPGETDEGVFRVYVEIERTRHIGEQIFEIIEGIQKLTGLDSMRFRYFKNFKSEPATLDNLDAAVPKDKNSYKIATENNKLNNFQEFFKRSYADKIEMLDESIKFKKVYSGDVSFDVIACGPKETIHNMIKGPIILETKDMAEVMFLTKVIGNYNIVKIGKTFIFENSNWAVALERK